LCDVADHVAFLRGINVGGHNKLPMADLRTAVESAGFGDVRTYIQSGNVVFDAPGAARPDLLAQRISAAIDEAVSLRVPVVVRTGTAMESLAGKGHPMEGTGVEDKLLMVGFCGATPGSPLDIDATEYAPDRAELRGDEVFLAYPEGSARSRLTVDLLERRLGVPVTVRNWRTIEKVTAMLAD
jgi:uncharacterized protein (DUF1697 family)